MCVRQQIIIFICRIYQHRNSFERKILTRKEKEKYYNVFVVRLTFPHVFLTYVPYIIQKYIWHCELDINKNKSQIDFISLNMKLFRKLKNSWKTRSFFTDSHFSLTRRWFIHLEGKKTIAGFFFNCSNCHQS